MSWAPYKNSSLHVPSSSTGDAGVYLTQNFEALSDGAVYQSTSGAPTSGDDTTLNFNPGSLWLDTSTQVLWICISNTTGGAVWRTLFERTSGALILCPADSGSQRAIQFDNGTANTRGQNAVDFQASRTASSQVASGSGSFIAAGMKNTASGTFGFAAGYGGTASGYGAHTEGMNCTGSGYGAHAEGQQTTASGDNSHAQGFYSKASLYAQDAHAAGRFAVLGDAQCSQFVLRNKTTNATGTELFLNGSSNRLVLSSNTTWTFNILVVAREPSTTNQDGWAAQGCITNNSGTVSLIAAVTPTQFGATGWSISIGADATHSSLQILATGAASTTINWVARVFTAEVTA
jgi:hypothetical protein